MVLATLASACRIGTGEPDRVVTTEADTAGGAIPMRLIGPNDAALVVTAVVNGDSLDMVLDTGATLTCLDREVADRLGLEEWQGALGYGVGVQGSGQMDIVRIDSLSIGGATAYDLMGCVLDLSSLAAMGADVSGLLGLNVLKSFRVVLDFPGGVLRLEPEEG